MVQDCVGKRKIKLFSLGQLKIINTVSKYRHNNTQRDNLKIVFTLLICSLET